MTNLRTYEEQVEGLMAVIEAASKLHRVNLVIYDPQRAPKPHKGTQLALTGAEHGRDTEIVYLIDGYDVWLADPEDAFGEHMVASNLSLDEAAHVIADAYMHDKAATVLHRYGYSTGGIEAFLEDDARSQWLFTELDKGSDSVRDGSPAKREAGLRQGIEAMIKQVGRPPSIIVTDP